MELESREGEEQLYKIWTPITHFRNYFAYVHLLNLRHLIIAKLRLFIDVNLWMKRHKPDSPDTRFWQKKILWRLAVNPYTINLRCNLTNAVLRIFLSLILRNNILLSVTKWRQILIFFWSQRNPWSTARVNDESLLIRWHNFHI